MTLCSAFSLLIFIAACALWARSYFRGDLVGISVKGPPSVVYERFARSNYGTLVVSQNAHRGGWKPRPAKWISHSPNEVYANFPPLGVHRSRFTDGAGKLTMDHVNLHVSYWLIAAISAMLPATWFRDNRRRRHRRRDGLCTACGYDVRASPGRCPECGATAGAPLPTSPPGAT